LLHLCATRQLHSFPTRRSSDLSWTAGFVTREQNRDFEPPAANGGINVHDVLGHKHGRDTSIKQTRDRGCAVELGKAARLKSVIEDRKSTRLNSSHQIISYAVFC